MKITTTAFALFLIMGCVKPGDEIHFKMNRSRTSNLIKDANLRIVLDTMTAQDTDASLHFSAQPILGNEVAQTKPVTIDNDLLSNSRMIQLRKGQTIQTSNGDATHIGYSEKGCDKIQFTKIPDSEEIKNIEAVAEICQISEDDVHIPSIDVDANYHGLSVHIGFDATH